MEAKNHEKEERSLFFRGYRRLPDIKVVLFHKKRSASKNSRHTYEESRRGPIRTRSGLRLSCRRGARGDYFRKILK